MKKEEIGEVEYVVGKVDQVDSVKKRVNKLISDGWETWGVAGVSHDNYVIQTSVRGIPIEIWEDMHAKDVLEIVIKCPHCATWPDKEKVNCPVCGCDGEIVTKRNEKDDGGGRD